MGIFASSALLVPKKIYSSVKYRDQSLVAGKIYPIKVEYFDKNGGAAVKLFWKTQNTEKQIIPSKNFFSCASDRPSDTGVGLGVGILTHLMIRHQQN